MNNIAAFWRAHNFKGVGIEHNHSEGDAFDSRSVQDLLVKDIFLTSLGIDYLRVCTFKTGVFF